MTTFLPHWWGKTLCVIHNIDTFCTSTKEIQNNKVYKKVKFGLRKNIKTVYGLRESKSSVHPDSIFKNILNRTNWCPCALHVTGQYEKWYFSFSSMIFMVLRLHFYNDLFIYQKAYMNFRYVQPRVIPHDL
jgi:hypothetical protein